MDTNNQQQTQNNLFKERQVARIFEEIDDELKLLTASAKFNFATCKTDQNTLNLTLAYIEDTKKLISILKNRVTLLTQITS
ncbi:MAG: hypothetical protein NWF01_00330 [Candidatus Bathyarchaeota archaeon]|nr:hypothetical protein [Candidatus Bathyarchaeota archaeon]